MLRRQNVTATLLSASILTLFLVSLSPVPQLLGAPSKGSDAGQSAALNPVQISIQTANLTSVSSYDLVAYNSTGALVASYTGQYPRSTFDLPSGTYLFAANANGPSPAQPPVCYASPQSKQVGGQNVSSPPAQGASSGPVASSAIAYPCYYSNPPSEYGYSLTQVSGSSDVTIATESPSAIPTADVSVTVSYKNGTAVSDADVSAAVVGGDWYWGGVSGVTMYAQTGADGVAHLVVPAVPMTVTASRSVQVSLPKSQTTMQVDVGGQLVNVTLYYSPNYVYVSAAALLIPPQTSLSMLVTAQTRYPLIPYAAGSAAPGQAVTNGATVSPGPGPGQASQVAVAGVQNGGTTAQTSRAATIPPIPASDTGAPAPTQPSSNASSINVLAIGTLALAGAVAAVVGIAISKARS